MDEMKEFMESWKRLIAEGGGSAVVRIERQFHAVFLNVIWSLLSGKRFTENDPQVTKFLDVTNKFGESGQIASGILGLFPALNKLAPRLTGFTEIQANNVAFYEFYKVMDISHDYYPAISSILLNHEPNRAEGDFPKASIKLSIRICLLHNSQLLFMRLKPLAFLGDCRRVQERWRVQS